jgi:hypothetical protein
MIDRRSTGGICTSAGLHSVACFFLDFVHLCVAKSHLYIHPSILS